MTATLPPLIESDIHEMDDALGEFLKETGAITALVIDKGGFLITHKGDARRFDLTTIAALASGAYMANETIANLVHETSFSSVYQQGEQFSMFANCIDEHCLLVVIFPSKSSVGAVKYFAEPTAEKIAGQLRLAQERDPDSGFDLSALNVADTENLFRKRNSR
jgi:predicted regulator of Ras-like GTPase activity (Roadblock/LC7/MglB family)